MNPGLIKNHTAAGAISPYRLVKFGAAEGRVAQASAPADPIVGVSTIVSASDGERVDVIHGGIAEVEYGGTITQGNPVTTDANGKAVAAAPAAGVNVRIIGFAYASGVSGDIGSVIVSPGVMQGQ